MSSTSSTVGPVPTPEWLAVVRENVERLRYGWVQLVVRHGCVTQIERTETMRLSPPAAGGRAEVSF